MVSALLDRGAAKIPQEELDRLSDLIDRAKKEGK